MAVATIKKSNKSNQRRVPNKLRRKRTEIIKMTQEKRFEELANFVKLCFMLLNEEETSDYKEISNKSGLSVSTIGRLANQNFTGCVRFNTVQSLGIAAGLRLDITEYKATVVLIR